jgi:two-component system sensor histidine kinase AlgZ
MRPAPAPAADTGAEAPDGSVGDTHFASTATRPASVWPDTADGGAGGVFTPSRFDPLAEERARLQAQAAAAFDVCHPALALRAVLLVQAALALVALAGADTVHAWGQRQAVLAFGGVVATLLWLVAVCAARRALRGTAAAGRAAVVLLLGALAALAAWWPLAWVGLAGGGGGLRIAGVALSGAALAALLWAWLDLRSRIWHPATASARLAELQSRIRPHFLFNALNTALALVRTDPTRAEAVLEDLAQLFRSALAEPGAAVTVRDEIELAQRYLAIEQVRFGARLQVAWEIDPRIAAARLPPLVLQPLVENAVRHGIEPAQGGGRVWVRGVVQRAQVVLEVINTVPRQGAVTASPSTGHGMALHNVRERLRLLHDLAAQCDVWREPGANGADDRFHARIVLPLG